MKKKIPLLFLAVLFSLTVYSQQVYRAEQGFNADNKGIVYTSEWSLGAIIHSNGASVSFEKGKLLAYNKTRFFHTSLGYLRHPREYRQSPTQLLFGEPDARSFIYGKENNFYVLRGGIGEKRYFSEKEQQKGVAVGMSYHAGGSLGVLKPYYLLLRYRLEPRSGVIDTRAEKYMESNAEKFLNQEEIYGAAGFRYGLDEIKLRPGVYGKFAFHFDAGAFDELLKAVEVGILADYYFTKVPIMIDLPGIESSENKGLFLNLYAHFLLGKRQ